MKRNNKTNNDFKIIIKKRDYKNSPTGINIFTIGLKEKYNHPEIQIVLNFKKEIIELILNKCLDKIKQGIHFLTDIIYDDILPKKYKIIFKEVSKNKYRMIFSDEKNNIAKDLISGDFFQQYEMINDEIIF
tara:strand:+ start:3157 stop:3549 length:393 start_codon:yes stop_codon:yes gene_type:complete